MTTQLSRILQRPRKSGSLTIQASARSFSSQGLLFSGHNRWSKIKHDKAKVEAGKSKQRSALTSEISTIAKRKSGPHPELPTRHSKKAHSRGNIVHGADPTTNPRLAALITIAKKSGLPKVTLEGAIARGAGKSLSGAALESITVEAMLPSSVAAIIECQTDNRLRTLSDIRYIIKELGGAVTPTNHLFERVGKIVLQGGDDVKEEDIFDHAIEAGATDVKTSDDGSLIIYTQPQETASTAEALAKLPKVEVLSSDIVWSAKDETKVQDADNSVIEGYVDKLEEDPSVQSVSLNVG